MAGKKKKPQGLHVSLAVSDCGCTGCETLRARWPRRNDPDEEMMVTEVTYEVAVRHYVTATSPNPTEEDVREAVARHLRAASFNVESVRATRI